MRKPRFGRKKGVVIIAVLWICALVMWFALKISTETRLQGEEQAHLLRKSQALHLAIGGCYEALARMGQAPSSGLDRTPEDSWQPDGTPHLVDYQSGRAVVIVEKEDQKINVNRANPSQLKAAFEKRGMEGELADTLADRIVDFVDKDDTPLLHGMEKAQYKQAGLHYGPINGPMVRLDQILMIPGMTQQLFYGYGHKREDAEDEEGTTDDFLLPARDSLFQMLTVYGSNTVLKENIPGEELRPQVPWTRGGVYRIVSCGRVGFGPPSVTVWLIVRFAPELPEGYQVLYRKIL
jgi:hypothetical protein